KVPAFQRFHRVRVSTEALLSPVWKAQANVGRREIRKASHPPAHRLRRDRCVIQPATVHLAAIRTESRACADRVGARVWRASGQPGMRAVTVVIALEIEKLHLQIGGRPEMRVVQAFAPDDADQPFNTWMRERRVWDRLDFLHLKDPKIPLPLAE